MLVKSRPHLFPGQREARLAFVMRWQQFTGPIMAKAFEDTFLYVYNPLVSLNEVGGDPRPSTAPAADFFQFITNRSRFVAAHDERDHYARHQAVRRRSCSHQCALSDSGRMGKTGDALVQMECTASQDDLQSSLFLIATKRYSCIKRY